MSVATRDDIPAIKSSRTRLEEFFYSVEVPITMSASALASAHTDDCTGNRKADQIFEQVLPTEFFTLCVRLITQVLTYAKIFSYANFSSINFIQ